MKKELDKELPEENLPAPDSQSSSPKEEKNEPAQVKVHEESGLEYIEYEMLDPNFNFMEMIEKGEKMVGDKFPTVMMRLFNTNIGRKLPFETDAECKHRRGVARKEKKARLKGELIWNSRMQGTYIKTK